MDGGTKFHFGSALKRIECRRFLIGFQVAIGQVVVGVLGHRVVGADNFVELLNGLGVCFHPIVRIAQLIEIGIRPTAPLAFVGQQIGQCRAVILQVKIAFPYDLGQLGGFFFIGSFEAFSRQKNGLVKTSQFKIHIGLEIANGVVVLAAVELIKVAVGLFKIFQLIGNISQVVVGIPGIFGVFFDFFKKGFGFFKAFGGKVGVSLVEVILGQLGLRYFFFR